MNAHSSSQQPDRKKIRYRTETTESLRHYTRWIKPQMTGYHMRCCDCGLVHVFNFRAVKIVKAYSDGRTFKYYALPKKEFQVEFRVRRNNKLTKRFRRHSKDMPRRKTQREYFLDARRSLFAYCEKAMRELQYKARMRPSFILCRYGHKNWLYDKRPLQYCRVCKWKGDKVALDYGTTEPADSAPTEGLH